MRLLIYTGKGGVGKTSIAAATAIHLAQAGRRTLIASTDQAHSLGDSLGLPLDGRVSTIMENLDALEIDPMEEGRRAWGNMRDYLKEIIAEKADGGIAADEALLFPGLEELLSLLRILDFYDEGRYDVMVVDCAPTGETLSMLRYPERLSVLSDALLPAVQGMNRALGGLISRATAVPKPRDVVFEEFRQLVKQLDRLQGILRERGTASVRLVMTPERIVTDEARRSYTWLQLYDFGVDAVYINKIYPEKALGGYFQGWIGVQEETVALARESFPQQRVFLLELMEQELCGIPMLEKAARQLYAEENPETVFCRETAFRIEEEQGTRIFIARLPYAEAEALQAVKEGGDLILSFRNETRRFHLPEPLRRRALSGWTYQNGELRVRMDY